MPLISPISAKAQAIALRQDERIISRQAHRQISQVQDLRSVTRSLGQTAGWYPWITPSVALASALAGLEPDDPKIRQMAMLDAANRIEDGRGLSLPGSRTNATAERPPPKPTANPQNIQWGGADRLAANRGTKGDRRTTRQGITTTTPGGGTTYSSYEDLEWEKKYSPFFDKAMREAEQAFGTRSTEDLHDMAPFAVGQISKVREQFRNNELSQEEAFHQALELASGRQGALERYKAAQDLREEASYNVDPATQLAENVQSAIASIESGQVAGEQALDNIRNIRTPQDLVVKQVQESRAPYTDAHKLKIIQQARDSEQRLLDQLLKSYDPDGELRESLDNTTSAKNVQLRKSADRQARNILGRYNGDLKKMQEESPEDFTHYQRLNSRAGLASDEAIEMSRAGLAAPNLISLAVMALDAPGQELQGMYRRARSGDFSLQSESNLGIFIDQALSGESPDIGQGFWVGPDSGVAKERYRRELESGTINGHVITLGRDLTNLITPFRPDTLPYDILSGMVDAGVMVASDPINIAAWGKGSRAFNTELIGDAGGAAGRRKIVTPEVVERWLGTKRGQEFVEFYQKINPESYQDIYASWKQLKGRMDPVVHFQLASGATDSPDYVRAVAREYLGVTQRGVPRMGPGKAKQLTQTRAMPTPSRLSQMMPHRGPRAMQIENPSQAIDQIDRFWLNMGHHDGAAKYVEEAMELYTFDDITLPSGGTRTSRIPTPDTNAWFDMWERMMKEAEEVLVAQGTPKSVAHDATTGYARQYQEEFLSIVDDVGRGRNLWKAQIGGKTFGVPGPHLEVEHLNKYLPLPDPRRLRRLSGDHRLVRALHKANVLGDERAAQFIARGTHIRNVKGDARFLSVFADAVQEDVWKPLQLATRPAWTVRVIGEEQARMSFSNLDAMFRHPISYIGWVVGPETALGRKLQKIPGVEPKLTRTLRDELLSDVDQWQEGMAINSAGWMDDHWKATGGWDTFKPGSRQYIHAYMQQLEKGNSDTLSRLVAENTLDGTPIDNLIAAGYNPDTAIYDIRFKLSKAKNREALARRRGVEEPDYWSRAIEGDYTINSWEDYVESIAFHQDELTSARPELLEVIANGRWTNKDGKASPIATASGKTNKDLRRHLEKLVEDPDFVNPPRIPGQKLVRNEGGVGDRYHHVVNTVFAELMAKRTTELSRNPVWKQYYWERIVELAPFTDSDTQARLLKWAKRENIAKGYKFAGLEWDGSELRKLQAHMDAGSTLSDDALTFKEIDYLAKGHALDGTKFLLYDLTERSQFMDAFRLVFPFGEAWKEVLTRWVGPGGIAMKNPRAPRRIQQAIREGRQNELIPELLGTELSEEQQELSGDRGFFFENSFGDEVFIYPGSEFITDKLIGAPIPMTGSLKGLSLATDVYPGFGPAVQMLAQAFLPDKPKLTPIKDVISPYGEITSFQDTFMPAWVNTLTRAFTASSDEDVSLFGLPPSWTKWIQEGMEYLDSNPESDRLWGNSVFDSMQYLVSTGEYSVETQADFQRTYAKGKEVATGLYVIRGLAQTTVPTSPIPVTQVETETGDLVLLRSITEEFNVLRRDPATSDTAVQQILDRYGPNLEFALADHSVPVALDIPTTKGEHDWLLDNGDIVEDYPAVFNFFSPKKPDDEFYYPAYEWSIETGDRAAIGYGLTIEDLVKVANDRMAWNKYRQDQQAIVDRDGSISSEAQDWLTRVRRPELEDQYYGFGEPVGPARADSQDKRTIFFEQLRDAANDSRLYDQPVSKALRQFFETHDSLITQLQTSNEFVSKTYFESKETAPMRNWMRFTYAPSLIDDYPEFGHVWERFLDRLMTIETESEEE